MFTPEPEQARGLMGEMEEAWQQLQGILEVWLLPGSATTGCKEAPQVCTGLEFA